MHAPQHRVAARLHRNMRVLGDARRRCHKRDEFVSPVHRLDRRNAKFFERSLSKNGADERLKHGVGRRTSDLRREGLSEVRGLRSEVQVPSPPPQINSADHHFAIARLDQPIHFANDAVRLQRSALPTHERDHAKRAAIVAPILNLEVGSSALVGGVEDGSSQQLSMRENIGDEDRASGFRPSASERGDKICQRNECESCGGGSL